VVGYRLVTKPFLEPHFTRGLKLFRYHSKFFILKNSKLADYQNWQIKQEKIVFPLSYFSQGISLQVFPSSCEEKWQAVHSLLVGPVHFAQEKSHCSHFPSSLPK